MVSIKFETTNDVFEGKQGFINETRRILENVWEKISKGQHVGSILDRNGNVVGGFEVTESW